MKTVLAFGGLRGTLAGKGLEGAFWGDGNIPYPDSNLGYIGVCICQNLWLVYFIVCT